MAVQMSEKTWPISESRPTQLTSEVCSITSNIKSLSRFRPTPTDKAISGNGEQMPSLVSNSGADGKERPAAAEARELLASNLDSKIIACWV